MKSKFLSILLLSAMLFTTQATPAFAANLADDVTTAIAGQEAHIDIVYATEKGASIAIGENYQLVNSSAIITAKPENAQVSAHFGSLSDFTTTGKTVLNVYSDTSGDITVDILLSFREKTSGQQRFVDGTVNVRFFDDNHTATQPVQSVVFMIGQTSILCDNQAITIDAAPIILDDRLYIPLRAFSQGFDAGIEYNETTQTVDLTKDNQKWTLTIDSPTIINNGESATLTNPPVLYNGNAYLPVRALAEIFGYTIELTTNGSGAVQNVILTR